MSLALSFLGGAPFQLLYDGVKKAISTTRNFRTQLINLEFTLGCLQPRIILQISNNNVQLSLPNDIIQDLQVKMNEGIDLVASLSKLRMWNIRIWGNCCNCLKPNFAEQLEDLDRSLNRLLELLRLEQIRNVTLLMLRQDDIERRLDDFDRRQSDILQAVQDIPGYISSAQQEVIQRMQANVEQQVRNGEGRAAAPAPVVGVVFKMLYDVVTKVKVKNLMFNRLLGELTYSLDCLKPLIEEIANNNKVLHLPVLELEDFVMEMEKAVEFVHKCSKVSKRANYRKYRWTNKLLQLDEHLQMLFIDFNGQLELKVKEAMNLVSNIEAVMNQTKGSGVVETHVIESDGRHSLLPQPHSPSVQLDLQNMLGTSTHVIEKTLVDTAEITEKTQESNVKLHVKNVQGASDVVKETLKSARNLEVGEMITEGTSFGVINSLGEWYNHQSVGSSITLELHPGWLTDKFIGFAMCAVCRLIKPLPPWVGRYIHCSLTTNGISVGAAGGTTFGGERDQPVGDHMCFFYMNINNTLELQDIYYRLEFSFEPIQLNREFNKENVQVKKCGVRVVYEQDVEELRQTYLLKQSDAKRGLQLSDDHDAASSSTSQAHPKRMKLLHLDGAGSSGSPYTHDRQHG